MRAPEVQAYYLLVSSVQTTTKAKSFNANTDVKSKFPGDGIRHPLPYVRCRQVIETANKTDQTGMKCVDYLYVWQLDPYSTSTKQIA